MIDVAVRHRQGDFALSVAFRTEARIVALFGPSGSGKTTLLNIIAGLILPDDAHVAVAGRVLTDTTTDRVTPPYRRRIGYVFQDARLFPHLTVRRNLLYGHWLAPRKERFASLGEISALLGISALLDRYPATLSGGE
jgi:molybdate transport system ATP-binding protein